MKTQAGHGDAQCTCGSTYIHKRVTRENKEPINNNYFAHCESFLFSLHLQFLYF